ncbi:MAG TPA: glycosyl hydrolase [Caproicibacter sp.]|nr:glycosyl hydrolase [Caproicibacter sp.]
MFYPQNQTQSLTMSLFKNPTREYRAAPFWAWNGKLDRDDLLDQIDQLGQMGFGGFHMHVRTGLSIRYLGKEYMSLIHDCVQRAKEKNMFAWLYDEDRWPSGAAGGLVTADPQYRARYLLFTPVPYGQETKNKVRFDNSTAGAVRTGNGKLLACYDIMLDENGCLQAYKRIGENDKADGTKWYAYQETPLESPWFNNQTYVNTLDKKAIQRFVEITHESYKKELKEYFGSTVPAIFTDEPQFSLKTTLRGAFDTNDVILPWTDDLPQTFEETYQENLISNLPQLVWELANGQISVIRYHYHDHIAERFASAFADTCGDWCRKNGIMLTGHLMNEPTLASQTEALGEAMRSYRSFDLPGIDMLCCGFEYATVKQAQSASHQFGREGLLSELYGVSGWDFDFRGHKLHGDWQAALGVTVRVPHLSWVSMAGEAKRDYPASINYQSPWYGEYSYIEDHFARVNTAMTRGKPIVRVGVIHPIESYWLHYGPYDETCLVCQEMEENFKNLTEWMLFGCVDFDFISESLLPTQCETGTAPIRVGKMAYDIVIVPGCETLRASTLKILNEFLSSGGKLIFMGKAPTLVDALPNREAEKLFEKSEHIPFTRSALLKAVESARELEIRNTNGFYTDNLVYQLRQDHDDRWLFVAHAKKPYNKDIAKEQRIRIRLKGSWQPVLYDTVNGKTESVPYKADENSTVIEYTVYDYDSLLFHLRPSGATQLPERKKAEMQQEKIVLPYQVPVTLSEPNALLLDMAEYALDGGAYQPEEEILILDNQCRELMGWPSRKGAFAQPWVLEKETVTHRVSLRFTIHSDLEIDGAQLAIEDAESLSVRLNGSDVSITVSGWYIDKAIKTIPLPKIKQGENILEVCIPFGRSTNIEWCYLLGNFGVQVCGRIKRLTPAVKVLAFGDIVHQGLPFYGGNLTYHLSFRSKKGKGLFSIPHYRGSLLKVSLDGRDIGRVVLPPYRIEAELSAGTHELSVMLFGNRYNSCGQLHLADSACTWLGPDSYRSEGDAWSYEYYFKPTGILSQPTALLENT